MKHKILELRPTQIALGMKEVADRARNIRSLKSGELDDFLHERRVPVVFAPKSRVYIVDRHHLVRACWEAGLEEVPVDLKGDFSHLSFPELWKVMQDAHWVYPYDQFGVGPHNPVDLPKSIRGLADDPFRSLAWLVRQAGGFEKTEIPFAEFQWANFFRKRMELHPVFDDEEDAVKEALALAKSPAASQLPGSLSRKKD